MHSHDSGHHHHHHPDDAITGRLIFSIVLNFIITASQIAGGLISNSLSLISDALHNLMDTLALAISLFARIISRKSSSPAKTFGYKRAEIIAAFANIICLILISFFLFKEAFFRLFNQIEINGSIMFVIALVGLAGNGISALLLYKSSKNNINIKSSFVHILSDAFSSIAVIVAGVLIIIYKWFVLDAVLTFLIGIYVLVQSWHMLMGVIHILMQGSPASVNISALKARIEQIPGVKDIHHIHVWSLTEDVIHFEGHVRVEKYELENMEIIKNEIKNILKQDFDVSHSTIEFETQECSPSNACQE